MIGRLKEAVSILQSGTAPDATIIDELIVSIDEYVKFTKETPKDSSIEIIENYQTLVQCTVSLLNKFNIILNAKNDDIFTIGKLDADQFDKRTINEPDYRSKVISSLLNLVSLVASINPKAFLSHWPLVLNDSLRVENSIESTSQPLMRIIERLQFCASLKEVALLSDEVNSLRKCIHTAPFRSIIFQSWFSPQLHKTDLPAIAIRCLQHMLTGVSLDRWLIQQTHHDSPKSAIPLNVGSKLLQTDIDYVRTVGVIGQGRSVVGKYSSLKFTEFPSSSSSSSSMEGKVTRAVLKILRVLSIELTLCYMDLVTAETVIMLRDCVSRLGPLLDLSSVLLLHIPLQNTFSSAGLNTRNEIESLCGDIFWLALRLSCQSQLSSSDMLRSTEQTSKGWKKSSCNESPRAMSSREAEDAMKEAQLIALKWCQSIIENKGNVVVFRDMLMKGCTEPFAVALLMQMEINWRPVVIGSIDEQLVADVVLDPYIRILVQFCDVPFSTSEVESSPIHSTANPNTHFPPTVIAARSLFLAILKAYLVTIAEPPPGELNVREGMLAEKGPSWLQTRVITPALHASCAQLQVFGFKILSLLTANITAPLSYRERGIVIPVSLEFVLRNASVSCSSEIHQARGAAISLYGHIKQECWQQVSLPERSTVINDAIRLSKDTVGSVRECALRVLGLVIANGIFTWSNHDAEHSNIIEMRLRSLETNVLCVLTDGLRDSKLTSRVQAAFSFGNLLSKLVTRRLAFISTPLLKEERAESGILSDNLSTVLQNSTDMTYVISMDESNGYSQYSLKCSPWISDSIWLALTFQCRSLLDGGDKALASVARCLGLLSMGLRLSNTAHEQCLMELFGALIDKILLRSGKKAKSPSNTHDEETVLTKATDIEQAAQCGIQTYSKKVTYSLAKSLSSVCTRLHTLDSSDQHGRPRALVIFGVLIRYGTTKIKQLACIGALSVCIVDIEKSNIAQKKVYFGEELLNLFENVIFTVCSPETSSWLRRGNTTYANTGEFERLLQFHSSLLRLLHVLLVVALQNRENSLDSTNVDTGSRFVDIVAHHSMELTDSLVTLTTWIAADRDMFTAILAEIESFVGCICEGLVSLSKPPSVSESSIGLNSGGGEVFVDESLFAFDHSVLLDQRLTESSETSIPFRVVAQWRSIAQSIRLSSASTTSTRESQIQGLSLTVHPIPNKNVAQSATDEFDSDNDEGDEF